MKTRTFLAAALAAGFAVAAFALTPAHVAFGRSAAQFLMTKEEAAKWKTITSDADADAFIALFWARRDPTPTTPRNEFREMFESRVAAADAQFAPGDKSVPGSLTDRGKAFVLYGKPFKVERTGNQRNNAMPMGISSNPAEAGVSDADVEAQVWTYEGDEAQALFGQRRAVLRFIDRYGRTDFRVDRGSIDLAAAQQRAITRALKQPNLTAAPTFAAAPQAGVPQAVPATEAAPAAAVIVTEVAAPLQNAINAFKATGKDTSGKTAFVTWGESVTTHGETFVPVSLYLPASSGVTANDALTFFGVVQDAAGKNVIAFEEPAKIGTSKGDFFVDRSLTGVPAGKYRGYFGLATADGTPVTLVATNMELAGTIDKDATAASSLILSNNLYPLTAAQLATDPYAFGGLKVVPKGDRTFRSSDELWYFVELRNPGVNTPAADAAPAEGEAAAGAPKVQVRIDVEGTDKAGNKKKMSAPPREIDAIAIKGVPGHYGIGNAIPLASFKPGEYTITLKVMDTVKKTSYTLSDKFRVVE